MKRDIKAAFDDIHADERLKQNTKAFVAQKMRESNPNSHISVRWKPVCMTLACACFMLVIALSGYRLYFTPTSVISIDINPSIELDINRFDRVVAVNGYNQDGIDFANSLDVLYMNYSEAVDTVLTSETISACLANDELLSIAVVESDEEQGEAILQYVSTCTGGQQNTHCYGIAAEEVADAHAVGLSYGKYRAFLELQAVDADITPEQVSEMTMRQIRDLLAQLQADDDTISQPGKTGNQAGNGSGTQHNTDSGNGGANQTGSGNGTGTKTGSGSANGNGNKTGSSNGKGKKNR